MRSVEALFWLCGVLVTYTYLGYGVVISVLAAVRPRPHRQATGRLRVTLIVAALNEEAVIRKKLANCLEQTYPRELLQVIVVSDGSTDRTMAMVDEYAADGVVSLHAPERRGKASAVSRAVDHADGDILVFSDANSMYSVDAIAKLVRNFADPAVGCVAGEKRIRTGDGAAREAGLYWRYESYLKRMDSTVNSVVGAAGEIFAVRRELYRAAEPDSFIEDFIMSMRIAASGYRVVYEPEAASIEEGPASLGDEFERRARIAAGGFQSIVRLRGLLVSGQPLLIFQYVSHRVLRWAVVPFLLPVLLLLNAVLARRALYRNLLVGQLLVYGIGAGGWIAETRGRRAGRIARVFLYFGLLNAACLAGFARYASGRQTVLWKQTERLLSSHVSTAA